MKTISAIVRNGQIALLEPVNWPEGTEVRVEAVGDDNLDALDTALQYLSVLLRELIQLRSGPERDEYGALRPTKHAFDVASQLLIDVAIAAATESRQIPLGAISVDSQGGVRVEWVRDRSSVHLVVPGSDRERPYLYHELGNDYATEDASPEGLARWLREID